MKDGVESLGRVRTKGIAILLLTFLVGGLAGAALERARASRRTTDDRTAPWWETRRGPVRPGRLPPMFSELNLTEEQRTRIRQIMEQAQPRTDEVLGEMLPRLRAITDSVHQEIRSVLTPDQAAQLDSLLPRGRFGPGHGRPGMRRRERGGPPPPLYWDPSAPHVPE